MTSRFTPNMNINDIEYPTLSKVEVPDNFDDKIERFAGKMAIPDESDLESDDRLQRIWSL